MTAKTGRWSAATLDWLVTHPDVPIGRWGDLDGTHDVRSGYCEQFWLPVIGPSALWAARRLADTLDHSTTTINLVDFGSSLGIGTGTGKHTQINRTIGRLVDFQMARIQSDRLEVRCSWPALLPQHRRRLPLVLLDQLVDHERKVA